MYEQDILQSSIQFLWSVDRWNLHKKIAITSLCYSVYIVKKYTHRRLLFLVSFRQVYRKYFKQTPQAGNVPQIHFLANQFAEFDFPVSVILHKNVN